MRLGKYPCKLKEGTHAFEAYGTDMISERHRHRYEVNNELKDELFSHGLIEAGTLPNGKLTEIVELPESEHPWFVGVQFHPELKSRPTHPHPLFKAFISAALANQKH
jgi:CTP synthase